MQIYSQPVLHGLAVQFRKDWVPYYKINLGIYVTASDEEYYATHFSNISYIVTSHYDPLVSCSTYYKK